MIIERTLVVRNNINGYFSIYTARARISIPIKDVWL